MQASQESNHFKTRIPLNTHAKLVSRKKNDIFIIHTHTKEEEDALNTEHCNVRGEPVFSVMAAGWICEKSG
jgi:hypothetical protein